MKLKSEVSKIYYCVQLCDKQWKSLNAINHRGDDRWDEVNEKLKKAGAFDVEYNGHFGRNIFFAIETAEILPRVLRCIEKITA